MPEVLSKGGELLYRNLSILGDSSEYLVEFSYNYGVIESSWVAMICTTRLE